MDWQRQVLEHPFEENSFAVVDLVPEGGADSLQDELCGAIECNGKAVALEETPRNDAREGVARSGIVRRQIGTGYLPGASVRAAAGDDGC